MIATSAISFKTLRCDTATYSNLTIHNTGTGVLRIDSIVFTLDNEGYSLAPPAPRLPMFLSPGADTNIPIEFAPKAPGTKIAALVVKSNAANSPVLTLNLAGQKDAVANILAAAAMGSDSGKAGDTVYIPVVIRSLNQTSLAGIPYKVRVHYDGSILLPIGVRRGTIDTLGAGYVVFTCNNAADTAVLICIVGLGDSVKTPIYIDTVLWGGCKAQTTWMNGIFTLTGLCTQGGTRLFNANGMLTLSQNAPNPFAGETVINYSTIEDGETELYITDALGRRMMTLTSGYRKAGKYTAEVNGDGWHSGIYYYALRTPTEILRKMMIIEK
jgi:hypothetical protein